MKQETEKALKELTERPKAGRRSSLHSSMDGLEIPKHKEGHPRGMIHDSEHVLGWNQKG